MAERVQAYLDTHSNVAAHLPGGTVPWIQRARDAGLSRFREIGFPSTRDEDWKYTNIRPIERQLFTPAGREHNGVASAQLNAFGIADLEAHRCVFVNGYFAPALSSLDRLPEAVTVTGLAAAMDRRADELELELGRQLPDQPNGFVALNTAFLMDGAYVRIGSGCVVDRPIELLHVATGGAQPLVAYPRNLVVAEANSQAVVLERYVCLDADRYLTNALTELVAHPSSKVEYYKLQEESPKAYHIGGLFVRQDRDSAVTTNNIVMGGAIARTDLSVTLNARGAHSILNGLYIGTGRQHIDNHTQVDHCVADCVSDEFYKGVLDGRARAVFHGRIIVHQDAQHTDAQQQNKNLLLSPDAEVDTKPQLEIYADDVKCSHGATVGQLDPSAVFYLRSRAIDEGTARNLLTYAFANDVINRFAVEPLRRRLEHTLIDKLLHGQNVEGLM